MREKLLGRRETVENFPFIHCGLTYLSKHSSTPNKKLLHLSPFVSSLLKIRSICSLSYICITEGKFTSSVQLMIFISVINHFMMAHLKNNFVLSFGTALDLAPFIILASLSWCRYKYKYNTQ